MTKKGKEAFDELKTISFDLIEDESPRYDQIKEQLKKIRVVLLEDIPESISPPQADDTIQKKPSRRHKKFIRAYELLKNLCYDTSQTLPWLIPRILERKSRGYATYEEAINRGKWTNDILISLHHAMIGYAQTEDIRKAALKISSRDDAHSDVDIIQTIMPNYYSYYQQTRLLPPANEKNTRKNSMTLTDFSWDNTFLSDHKSSPSASATSHQKSGKSSSSGLGSTIIALSVGSIALLYLYDPKPKKKKRTKSRKKERGQEEEEI